MIETTYAAPTETEREGLTESQYATVRTPKNSNSEKLAEMSNSHLKKSKVCCHCKFSKPLADFSKNSSTKDGYMKQCKICHSISQKKWQLENKEKVKEIANKYNRTRGKEYKAENFEKIKNYLREYGKQWRKQNVDKCFSYKRNRRARELSATGKFTRKEFIALCEKYDNRCLCCGKRDKLHADHVVPLSRGGGNGIENIQPLCKTCNMKKGTKTIDYR